MSFYWFWLKKALFFHKNLFQPGSFFSLLSLILAVACLTVAVLAFNGVSASLENIFINKQGHIRIQAEGEVFKSELLNTLSPYKESLTDKALFLSFPALLLEGRQFKGLLFEALEDDKLKNSPFLKHRILKGDLSSKDPFLVLGLDLAKELNVSVNSSVEVIVFKEGDSLFSRQQARFKVGAIADFGRYDFNTSFALMPLSYSNLLGFDKVSGISLWLKKPSQADVLKQKLELEFGESYLVQLFKEMDPTFFIEIESDKKIIFFVLLILIISAGFNVSSSLFSRVFKKTKEISLLRALGANKATLRNLFLMQGFVLGFFGSSIGVLLGLSVCRLLIFIQNKWHFIPSKVYQVNEMAWDWQSVDLFIIFIASLVIVLLSSVWPAMRAYKMPIQRGLTYD